ncbi:MAG TPA: sugar ABC transporter permease, partial [Microbacteriaceae bacterium]|nr:sugar ABC transporter permease [Microbacteriaceae bacterium]
MSRRSRAIVAQRPGFLAYGFLAVILVASVFPLYWTVLIGSGDSSTLNDPTLSWIPGGNFVKNAMSVIGNESVNFWKS